MKKIKLKDSYYEFMDFLHDLDDQGVDLTDYENGYRDSEFTRHGEVDIQAKWASIVRDVASDYGYFVQVKMPGRQAVVKADGNDEV